MQKQPARVNYFFKDGYSDFGRTVANTFGRCGQSILDASGDVSRSFSDMWETIVEFFTFDDFWGGLFLSIWNGIKFGLFLGKLIFVAVLTPVLCAIFSVLQVLTLVIVMGCIYTVFIIVAGIDGLYTWIKKISTSCPRCQQKYALPTYVCECGREHTKLVPSKYGVFTRECECGRKLRTTFFNGRQKLPGKWICPHCSYEHGGPLQVSIAIPVVGGPSSGKTCYINMAIKELEETAQDKYGLIFEYQPNYALGDEYENNKKKMESGVLPAKTSDKRMKYYQFYLTPKGEKVRNQISLCDVAGEAYENNMDTSGQLGYKYANAFLMVVDPLSVIRYRQELNDQINLAQYGASQRPMDEVLNTLIVTLEKMNCINSKNSSKTEVVVMFSKCDIPGIDDKIGMPAVKKYMEDHPDVKNQYDAQNKVCEQFLIDYEEGNFINILKSKFKSIQFFTCSALGHVENGQKFDPENVEDPLLWLIDKSSASIDLKKKWGHSI